MQNIWCLAGICSTKLSIKRCLCKRLWLTRLGILMLFFSHCYGSLPLKKLAPSSDFEMYQKSKGSSACVPNGTLLPFFFFFFKGLWSKVVHSQGNRVLFGPHPRWLSVVFNISGQGSLTTGCLINTWRWDVTQEHIPVYKYIQCTPCLRGYLSSGWKKGPFHERLSWLRLREQLRFDSDLPSWLSPCPVVIVKAVSQRRGQGHPAGSSDTGE